ncbi:MAG: PAS domain S-box protein [Chloroflexaceae bacterium]|nr:PAS domain S-box protein [Chloroflexaceae bacterium]
MAALLVLGATCLLLWRRQRILAQALVAAQAAATAAQEQEARLNQALAQGQVGIWWLNLETRKLGWSAHAATIFHLPADDQEPAQAAIQRRIHPDDRARVVAAFRQSETYGDEFRTEMRLQGTDGVCRWLEVTGGLVRRGNQQQVAGIVRNITAQKEAELALQQNQALLQSIMDNAPVSIVVWSVPEYRCMLTNERAARFMGHTPAAVTGKLLSELFPPAHVAEAEAENATILATGQAILVERFNVDANGRKSVRLASKFPIVRADGQITGIGGIYMDVTRQKQVEEELRQLTAELEQRINERTAELATANAQLHASVAELEQAQLALRVSEERLDALLEFAPLIIWGKNAQGLYEVWSRQAEMQSGLSAALVLGKTDFDIYSSNQARLFQHEDQQVLTFNRPMVVESKNTTSGKTSLIYKFPLCNERGQPYAVYGMAIDITERKQIELALLESQTRLRLLNSIGNGIIRGEAIDTIVALVVAQLQVAFPTCRVGYCSVDGHQQLTVLSSCQPSDMPSITGEVFDWQDTPAYFQRLMEGEGVVVQDIHQDCLLTEKAAAYARAGICAFIDMPVRYAERLVGVLFMDSPQIHVWSDHELATMREVAEYLALSLKDTEAQQQRQRATEISTFLAEGSSVLSASLDYEVTLDSIAHIAVPFFADLCSITRQENGQLRRVAVAIADPEKQHLVEALKNSPVPINPSLGVGNVLESAKTELIANFTYNNVTQYSHDESYRRLIASTGARSVISAPLLARGQMLGTISFVMAESGRAYGPDDLALAEELARRAALAMDNARLYREARVALRHRDESLEARLNLERQMLHTQKLESLGVLAGGIAHDFNNLLTAILGNASLAMLDLEEHHPAYHSVLQVEHAARRAADLARQMLAYSGRGHFSIETLNFNEIITEMTALIRASISKMVFLETRLSPNLPLIDADVTQIRQVVLNLILNAAEAIGESYGTVTVSTTLVDVSPHDPEEVAYDLAPGSYVQFTVADTGCGMDEATQAKIFEPFFTTKFTGRGLGLAAVQGIVRGHHGAIQVASTLGMGTTFTIAFPQAREQTSGQRPLLVQSGSWQGHGTVLVVDDEPDVRTTAAAMLERWGFTVLTAADGQEALEIYDAQRASISLVLLDLTMPRLSGDEALAILHTMRPDLPVVVMSGYRAEEITPRFAAEPHVTFLQKPFSADELQAQVRLLWSDE